MKVIALERGGPGRRWLSEDVLFLGASQPIQAQTWCSVAMVGTWQTSEEGCPLVRDLEITPNRNKIHENTKHRLMGD